MYKDIIVNKPWGYEYLCYQNEYLAIWFLFIKNNYQTSLHCHPNKHTGLVVLDGLAEISFLRGSVEIRGLEKIHIFKSRFHSTKALSDDGVFLLEVETPEDKHDLLRLEDSYGREDMAYEGVEHEREKDDSCIWLNEHGDSSIDIHGCSIEHKKPIDKYDFSGFSENDFFIVSRGGVFADEKSIILRPSDVIDGVSIERLLNSFFIIPGSTFIHVRKIKND